MIDSNVWISLEKRHQAPHDTRFSDADGIYVSAVIASELLAGVFRADNEERRQKRLSFVEAVLAVVEVLDFTLPRLLAFTQGSRQNWQRRAGQSVLMT